MPGACLSPAQDSRLNYIQQHAERIGVDAGRMDSVRVSAARSSPMGDTLELCARYADAASVEALVPRLVPLVSLCVRGDHFLSRFSFGCQLLNSYREMKPFSCS